MKKNTSVQIAACVAAMTIGLTSGPLHAATLSWTGLTGTTDTPVAGTWDTSGTAWSDGTVSTPDTIWSQTSGTEAINAAVFGGGAGVTVMLGEPIAAQRIKFAVSGYTLDAASAQTISLTDATNGAGVPQIEVGSGVTATIGPNVTVQNGIKTGLFIGELGATAGGTLNIYGKVDQASANSGGIDGFGTVVNIYSGGILSMNAGSGTSGRFNIGQNVGADVTVNVEGGTLSHDGSASALNIGAGGNGTLNVNSGSVTFTTNATNGMILGNGAGSGVVNLNGGVISAAIIKSGAGGSTFNFNGGTLRANTAQANMLTVNRANVRNNGAVIDTNGFAVTIAQALEHSNIGGDNAIDGGLTKNGAGVLTLTGANTYTGATTVNGGTLQLGATGSILSTSSLILNTGTFDMNGASSVTLGAFDLLDNSTINFGDGINALVFSATDGAWNGTLTITGFDATAGDTLRIGTSSILTDTQLAEIAAAGFAVTGQDSNGFVQFLAVPEPGVVALLSVGGLVFLTSRRRRDNFGEMS